METQKGRHQALKVHSWNVGTLQRRSFKPFCLLTAWPRRQALEKQSNFWGGRGFQSHWLVYGCCPPCHSVLSTEALQLYRRRAVFLVSSSLSMVSQGMESKETLGLVLWTIFSLRPFTKAQEHTSFGVQEKKKKDSEFQGKNMTC